MLVCPILVYLSTKLVEWRMLAYGAAWWMDRLIAVHTRWPILRVKQFQQNRFWWPDLVDANQSRVITVLWHSIHSVDFKCVWNWFLVVWLKFYHLFANDVIPRWGMTLLRDILQKGIIPLLIRIMSCLSIPLWWKESSAVLRTCVLSGGSVTYRKIKCTCRMELFLCDLW